MQSYLQRFAGSKRSWLPDPDPDDAELTAKRRRNDERHHSRWSSIIDRYSKDFTDCGDEVDLATGEIVVDKGHLARMRDEFDNGDGVPSSSQRPLNDMVGRFISQNGASTDEEEDEEISEGEEGLLLEDYRSDMDEDDDEEDELNSEWPTSSPQEKQRRPVQSSARKKVPSPVESAEEDAEQITGSRTGTLAQANSDKIAQRSRITREKNGELDSEAQTSVQPNNTATLPQFQMPELGLGGQLETAMQAMSTAMGAAIQAQMMAFMNVVLATSNSGAGTNAAPSPIPQPFAVPAIPQPFAVPAIPQRHHSNALHTSRPTTGAIAQEATPANLNRRRTQALSGASVSGTKRTSKNDLRGQTPGFGSLWAVPGERRRRRTGEVATIGVIKPAHETRVVHRSPNGRTSLSALLPQDHEDSDADDELRSALETSARQAPPSSPSFSTSLQDARVPSTRTTVATVWQQQVHPAPQTSLSLVQYEVFDPHSAHQSLSSIPYIEDSDDDEISSLAPSSSSKKPTPLKASSPAFQSAQSDRSESVPSLRSSPHAEILSDMLVESVELPLLRPSHSRQGLRNKSAGVNYNEVQAFNGMLDPDEFDDAYFSRLAARRRDRAFHGKPPPPKQPKKQENKRAWAVRQHGPRGIPPTESRMLPFVGGPDNLANATISSKQAANISLPRTSFHPRPPLRQWENFLAMSSEELDELYHSFHNHNKREGLKYEDKPPPVPCVQCSGTTATSWLRDGVSDAGRTCNACHTYMRKHDGQKRSTTLEELRSLKDRIACDNCTKLGVRDWDSIVYGKRLCRACRHHAKTNNGAMRPVPQPKLEDCERCKNSTANLVFLSNRSKVCIECHNIIFADYEPEKHLNTIPDTDNAHDSGEAFFDRCLLIFTHNLMSKTERRLKSMANTQNAGLLPCKACHVITAASWRPALDNAMICEPCYYVVRKTLKADNWGKLLGTDLTGKITGLKTSGFDCMTCKEPIVGPKWRADKPGGRSIVCTTCFNKSHKPEYVGDRLVFEAYEPPVARTAADNVPGKEATDDESHFFPDTPEREIYDLAASSDDEELHEHAKESPNHGHKSTPTAHVVIEIPSSSSSDKSHRGSGSPISNSHNSPGLSDNNTALGMT